MPGDYIPNYPGEPLAQEWKEPGQMPLSNKASASQVVKNLPAMQEMKEMWVQSLGWEDPLEEGMATHSSILAWRIPWTEEPGGHRVAKSQTQLSDCTELKER